MRSRLRLFLPLLLTLSLGILLWLGLGNNPYSQDEATLGRTLPAWQSDNLLDGSRIQTASLKGEPFVLNVWASWCTNCRAEHPLLSELAGTVPLYGLNYRDKGDAARAWLIQAGNPYRAVLADPDGKLALELGVYGTPETYLFAGDGTLLTRHTGLLTREIWQRQFAPLLAKARSNTASQPEVERKVERQVQESKQ
ncbi:MULTISPECIES: DsbE family thiol:disulfide interchange protein [unclassified Aeromonas]|uniref:DsbE family thiol:disulfide interchange protein n=1 Tax=unclassified Aeromonas TaxID=257493 RepID=UPI00084B322A|nr:MULTISPECIES: DsbE family thiol:disulfide interchange protein [unclassified Aeromonas]OEC51886.1 thiol:disulfide interchange protein [Aeromonas sp. ANNP30]OEC62812.1 thiol:disulfide interchange protein [Aeromonas sp. ANP5]